MIRARHQLFWDSHQKPTSRNAGSHYDPVSAAGRVRSEEGCPSITSCHYRPLRIDSRKLIARSSSWKYFYLLCCVSWVSVAFDWVQRGFRSNVRFVSIDDHWKPRSCDLRSRRIREFSFPRPCTTLMMAAGGFFSWKIGVKMNHFCRHLWHHQHVCLRGS